MLFYTTHIMYYVIMCIYLNPIYIQLLHSNLNIFSKLVMSKDTSFNKCLVLRTNKKVTFEMNLFIC